LVVIEGYGDDSKARERAQDFFEDDPAIQWQLETPMPPLRQAVHRKQECLREAPVSKHRLA
jgi:hypothetical protein